MITPQKRIWGWWAFDWANQPYSILLITFIFAPYFATAVAPDPVTGQVMWGWMLAISGVVIAICAPILGAIADSSGKKTRWLVLWSAFYLVGACALWIAVPGADQGTILLVLLAFAIGLIGLEYGIVFTNSYLPTLGPREDLGRISGTGWAIGYLGGLVALFIVLLALAENDQGVTLIGIAPIFGLDPDLREGTRFVGPFSALWYVIFVIPFFLWVREPRSAPRAKGAVRKGLADLVETVKMLPKRRSMAAHLGSSMIYRDGLNGIYAFGGIYAAGVLGWSIIQIGIFGILAAAVGALGCWLAGKLDSRFGPKLVIIGASIALIAVCTIIVTTDRSMVLLMPVSETSSLPDIVFYICGGIIGAAGGSLQASARAMMVRQCDPARMTEGFGLFALSGKALSFVSPALIAAATMITESQRLGVTPLIGLFVLGLILLIWVDPEGEPEFRCAAPSP